MLADVLNRIPDKPERKSLPADCLRYLQANRIPGDIVADLQASSYADWISVGPLLLLPMPRMIEETTGILTCIENGFLTLAGGANGDPVALCRDTRKMVFISHELLWGDLVGSFSECIQESPYLYEDFWEHVIADAGFPWDHAEASREWGSAGPAEPGLKIWRPDD